MSKPESEKYLQLLPGWTLSDNQISKEYKFTSYLDGLGFAETVGLLAEREDHHPDILVKWKRVRLTFTTHSIKGLSMNDFIIAAKCEKEYEKIVSRPPG